MYSKTIALPASSIIPPKRESMNTQLTLVANQHFFFGGKGVQKLKMSYRRFSQLGDQPMGRTKMGHGIKGGGANAGDASKHDGVCMSLLSVLFISPSDCSSSTYTSVIVWCVKKKTLPSINFYLFSIPTGFSGVRHGFGGTGGNFGGLGSSLQCSKYMLSRQP